MGAVVVARATAEGQPAGHGEGPVRVVVGQAELGGGDLDRRREARVQVDWAELVDGGAGQGQGRGPGQPDGRGGVEVEPVGEEPVVVGVCPGQGEDPAVLGDAGRPGRRHRAEDERRHPGPPACWPSAAWCRDRRSSGWPSVGVGDLPGRAGLAAARRGGWPAATAENPAQRSPIRSLVVVEGPAGLRPGGRSRTGGRRGWAGRGPVPPRRRWCPGGRCRTAVGPEGAGRLDRPGQERAVGVPPGGRLGVDAVRPDQDRHVQLAPADGQGGGVDQALGVVAPGGGDQQLGRLDPQAARPPAARGSRSASSAGWPPAATGPGPAAGGRPGPPPPGAAPSQSSTAARTASTIRPTGSGRSDRPTRRGRAGW